MADTTTVMALPYPEGSDANDVPADMQALAERLDEAPGIESLTSAEISGLSAGEKPAGRVVYNSTTSKLQVSNGSSFANIDAAALLLAGGTMAGNIAMGSNKVTGLAAATTNGDAVRYEQLAATDASVAALGTWTAWTPTLTASSSNPTASNVTAESRYMQIGKTVIGKAQMTVSAAGSGNYRIPLPVTPRSTAVSARRIGMLQLDSSGYLKHMLVEQANGATYCNAVELTAGDLFEYLTGTMVANWISTYGSPANITWDFQYEAA